MNIPHSDNIIFYDSEFTDLNPKVGELLSIGLVKPNGKELYIEFDYSSKCHPWVVKNVLPYLEGVTIPKKDALKMIRKFVGKDEPFLVSYVNQLDAVYWYDLFGSPKGHPAFWIPIDFASILFAYGYAPNSMGSKRFLKKYFIDRQKAGDREHNALDDARMLREVYINFFKDQENMQSRKYK